MTRPRRAESDPADAPAFRAAREVCRRQAKGLYFASAFLPRPKRDAAHAVFAFCRMIREAIESTGVDSGSSAERMRHRPLGAIQSPAIAMAGLSSGSAGNCCSSHPLDQRVALFHERLDDLYDGRLELPSAAGRSQEQHVLHAFSQTVRRYQIPRQYFRDLAEGCRMDLSVSRYATWTSLDRYCHHAGGAAGLVAGCVLGLTHSGAAEFAVVAGKAIRYTEVLRDLKIDADAGRVYLPLEDLAAFRYGERDLSARVVNDRFRELMRFQVARARRLYREATDGLCWVAGDGSRLAAATVLVWHSGILDEIERKGYDVFSGRVRLTRGQKLRRLRMAWKVSRRRPALPGPTHDAAPPVAAR